jgi:hypothetical protein
VQHTPVEVREVILVVRPLRYARSVPASRVWLLMLAACKFEPPDAIGTGIDAPKIDAPAIGDDRHVLITEIASHGNTGEAEFVEIYNPTTAAVDLSTYYLSDDPDYWKLPSHTPQNATIVLDDSDFLVRFPTNTSIASGTAIVIAVRGDDFMSNNLVPPDFTIKTPITGAGEMVPVVVTPGAQLERFTNEGEMLVLFQWDGSADLVRDVDFVVHGATTDSNNLPILKEPVDGPDDDAATSSYHKDALSFAQMPRDMLDNESYKRISAEGSETRTEGNGITGHDETTENFSATWMISTGTTPFVVPPGL